MSFLSKDQYIFLELGEDESGEVKLITYTFSENDDGTAKKDSKQSKPEADDPEYKKVLIAKNCVEYYEAATILKHIRVNPSMHIITRMENEEILRLVK